VREDWDTGAIEVTDELVGRRVRTRSRVRALPRPSKVWASLFRTLAWMGSIVTLALVVPTITAHDLFVQGGLATAVGRVTGMLGTYLLLVTVTDKFAPPTIPPPARRSSPPGFWRI